MSFRTTARSCGMALVLLGVALFTLPGTAGEGGKFSLPSASPAIPGSGVPGGGTAAGTFGGGMGVGASRRSHGPVKLALTRLGGAHSSGWRMQLSSGLPLATPAVAHGLVFFGGGYGSHEFYAIHAGTGKLAWKHATDDDGPTAAIVEGDDVLFNTESCTLYCLSARTGKLAWKKWLGDPLMNQPSAWKGRVYIAYPAKDGAHYLACLDIRTGRSLWKRPIVGDIISAPIIDDGVVYLTTIDGTLWAYRAQTGERLWRRQERATSAPWAHEGRLYVSRRAAGSKAPAGGRGRSGDVPGEDVAAILADTGRVVRSLARRAEARYLTAEYNRAQQKAKGYEALDSGVGFGGAGPPSAKLEQARANFGLSNVASVWAFQGSRPCVYRGRLYTSQHDLLRCVELQTGRYVWEAEFSDRKRFQGGRALTPPVIAGGSVYLVTGTGQLVCLDAMTGRIQWHAEIGETVSFPPAVVSGRVYLASDLGSVYSIDARNRAATGWAMWGGNARHNGWSPPTR